MVQVIALQAVPSQTLGVVLAGQACGLSVYQKTTGLYLDLTLNQQPVVSGALCLSGARLVRDGYLGLVGDLAFFDAFGRGEDPVYGGLGTQFFLAYLAASEL
jgi:hypothetical protein